MSLSVVGSVVGIVSGVSSIFGGGSSSSAASGASDSAGFAAQVQAETAREQMALLREQWDYYKTNYQPLEGEIIAESRAGIQPDYDRVAAEARGGVASEFDAQRGAMRRSLSRYGVDPGSPKYAAMERRTGNTQAALMSGAANTARTAERLRVEDTNYNRRLQAMSLGKGIPAMVSGGMSSAGSQMGASAGIYGNLARQLSQESQMAGYGGMQALQRGIQGLQKVDWGGSSWGTDEEEFVGNGFDGETFYE